MLKNILKIENIKLKAEANSWEDAIKEAGNILLSNKYIKEEYIDSMINSVKRFGPYIVITPGVAFAHAKPDKYVLNEGISLITLKNPVKFGCGENDPVSIVFAFCAKSENEHMQALMGLANFLEEEENIELLKNSENINNLYEKIC